jgi:amidase
VLLNDLKADLATYLASLPKSVAPRTLADLIAFNDAHADRELALFGQELFLQAEATKGPGDPDYRTARATSLRMAGADGIDRLLADNKLDALVAPTTGPAWLIDDIDGDHDSGSAATLPAVAGYPHLCVPMGLAIGLPVGLSFIGPAWSDARMLAFGYAFEKAAGVAGRPRL